MLFARALDLTDYYYYNPYLEPENFKSFKSFQILIEFIFKHSEIVIGRNFAVVVDWTMLLIK
jgi:hypothetical protein